MRNSSNTRTKRDAKRPGDVPAFVFVADGRAGMTATFQRAVVAKVAESPVLECNGSEKGKKAKKGASLITALTMSLVFI